MNETIIRNKIKVLAHRSRLAKWLAVFTGIEECGYVKETCFVWLKQKRTPEHRFEKIGKLVQVTTYVEPNKIKKLTGVKTREFLFWITLGEIYVDDPPIGKITFKTPIELSRSFQVSAFP
ncbi:hypothetical protein Fot_52599 [Forsythia ovata]|uniref:Uncharacterized protein n=1 Tax=Forsythia ovata TaxID=205694 RepID=A0ABD1PL61_9LAMI